MKSKLQKQNSLDRSVGLGKKRSKHREKKQKQAELRVVCWPIDRLVPFFRNSPTHSDAQIAEIANGISAFGFASPVLVGPDYEIVVGDARVLAARRLGLTELPLIVLGHLSKTQRRALAILGNLLGTNAAWCEALLARVIPMFWRITVTVYPSGDSSERYLGTCDGGVVVAAVSRDGDAKELEVLSGLISSEEWGRATVQAYLRWHADFIIVDDNGGADMVCAVIQQVQIDGLPEGIGIPVKLVSRDQRVRREPMGTILEWLN